MMLLIINKCCESLTSCIVLLYILRKKTCFCFPFTENSETIPQKQKQKDPEFTPRDSTSSRDTINQKDDQSETKTVESEQPLTQSDSKNKTPQNTVQEEIAVLMKFKPGQVYNSSLGSQIHVLPAQNISHVDVVVL